MGEFWKVWDIARKVYDLERIVHADLEEAYIKIFRDGKVIVRADGAVEDIDYIYFTAARRLLLWMKYQKKRSESHDNSNNKKTFTAKDTT